MAANQEEVVYQYTGDVSSLKQATEAALGLLNKYQSQIDRISADGGFGKNAKAAKSFQSQLKSTTSQFASMQKQMQGVSDVKVFPSSSVAQQLQSSLTSINQVYGKLASSSALSTKEVRALASQVKSANVGLKSQSADISSLIQKEQQWQQTLANVHDRTVQFRSSLDGLKGKVSSVFDPLLNRLRQLSTPFVGIITKIQTFKDKARESFGRVSQLANTVSAAFRRVSTAEDGSANSTNRLTAAHSRFRSVLSNTQSALKKETSSISKEKNELKNKSETLKKSTKDHGSLRDILLRLGAAFSSETNRVKIFNTNIKITQNLSKLLKNAFSSLVGIPLSQWLASAVQQSINFTENLNLFRVAMGEAYDVGAKFIDQMAEIYGMDPSNLMRYAGNFYQLSDAIGMPAESASGLTLSLVKMTNDLSSLFNVPIEKVFEDMSSGMQGMSRAVRKYGMDIRATTLQQTALTLGITANVETMSEANRQGLRFITMLRQAKNASGDFARTIESPANQLKIFKEQMSQLGRAIGDLFIKPLSIAIQYINGFVMALRMAINFIGSILGLVEDTTGGVSGSTDEVAESVEGIGTAAGGAAKKLKALLAPFDELNVLNDQSETSGGGGGGLEDLGALDPAIAAEIEAMELKLENIRMKALDVRDAFLEFFGFTATDSTILSWDASVFEANLISKFPQWTQTIQATFANWSAIVDSFKNVFNALGDVAQAVWEKIAGFFGKFINDDSVSSYIDGLAESLNKLASFMTENASTIADFIIIVTTLVATFRALAAVTPLIISLMQLLEIIGPALAGFGQVLATVAAVVAVIALLYANSEAFAASFDNLIQTVWTDLQENGLSIQSLFATIWQGLQDLWNESVQPMLKQTSDALVPVLDTITSLWSFVSSVITDFVTLLESVWVEIIQPVFAALCSIIEDVMEAFRVLWEELLGPIIEEISSSVQRMWTNFLKPIIDKVIRIISDVIDILNVLWNVVLAPIIAFLVQYFAPTFKAIFQGIWKYVEFAIGIILSIIDTLLGVFSGVIEFLAGVFTLDWKKAFSGLLNIVGSLGNGIIGVFESALNFCISMINQFLTVCVGGFKGFINGLGDMIESIASFLGYDISLGVNWNVPQIPKVSIPRIPTAALATGGVVTSPTLAMVGEGKYDEAVIPLGNSPQMNELIDRIAEASRGRSDDTPVQVQVYIGPELIAEHMQKANRRYQLQTNGG